MWETHGCRAILLCMAPFASAVGVRAAAAAREARKSWPTKRDFIERLASDSSGAVATVLDVGANDGAWTREMMRLTKANDKVRFILVEPQPRFHESLSALAATRPGSALLAGAAWTHSGENLTLSAPRDSRAASVISSRQQQHRASGGIVVPTIDLAALLLTLPHHTDAAGRIRAAPLAYLHLDIEGAEFAILPSLLLSHALCRLTHLHVEWHIPSLAHVSPADAAGGIGLRVGLETLLERGCSSANVTHTPTTAATTAARTDHEHEAMLLPPSRPGDRGSGGAGSPLSTARPRVMVDHEESTGAGASHAMALKALAHSFPVVPAHNVK